MLIQEAMVDLITFECFRRIASATRDAVCCVEGTMSLHYHIIRYTSSTLKGVNVLRKKYIVLLLNGSF